MCGDGNSMAIMLAHRSTALGRDVNSLVLKHSKFGLPMMVRWSNRSSASCFQAQAGYCLVLILYMRDDRSSLAL